MTYEVIHDISHEQPEERVNARIEAGWEPLGGINVCAEYDKDGKPSGSMLYSQAIIKH
jgi:hypothetical protein